MSYKTLVYGVSPTDPQLDVPINIDDAGRLITRQEGSMATLLRKDIVRPADTTPYAADDCINETGSDTAFQSAAVVTTVNNGAFLVNVLVTASASGGIWTPAAPRLRLWILNGAGNDYQDNAPLIGGGDKDSVIGYIDLDTSLAGPGTSTIWLKDTARLAVVPVGTTSVYWVLTTKDAFTPESGMEFHVTLTFSRS